MKKLALYLLRWQASSPILFGVMTLFQLSELEEVILANLVGALIFYNVDRCIFTKKR